MSYTPTGFVRQSDGAILVVSTNDAVTQAAVTPASLTAADPTTLGTAIIVATVGGVDQRTTGAGLIASQTISINALPLGPNPASANDIMVPVFSVSANGPVRYPLATLLALGSGSSGSTGSTTATTFTVAVSPASGTVGSTTNLTVTPGSGGWPSGQVITPVATGVSGTFDQSSKTGSGTNAVVFVFTSSAAGSGTLSATASGMTLSGSAASYAATTAGSSGSASSLTMTNATYADRGDGSGKKMLTGGTASGTVTFPTSDYSIQFKSKYAGAEPSRTQPFIKVTNSSGDYVGLISSGGNLQCASRTFTDNGGGNPSDTAAHTLRLAELGGYIQAYVDSGSRVSQSGQQDTSFGTKTPVTLSIDMSLAPPGLYSLKIYDQADPANGNLIAAYEFDGSGAKS